MMCDDLQIAVIGVGGRGGVADYAHLPGKGSRLVAGADISPDALDAFAKRIDSDVLLYDDYRRMLDRRDIDAVFIASPDFCHEEHAVAALEAGKAVYLEKPIAIDIAGCDRILEAAYRSGSKLYVGHNMRHMPFVLKMKQLIDDGRIGKVKAIWVRHFISYGGEAYFKDWHAERRFSNSLLLQKGAHDIDIIHMLGGGYTQRVHAMGALTVYGDVTDRRKPEEKPQIRSVPDLWPPSAQTGLNPTIDVEDLSMMQMQLDNGVFASYQQCHFTPDAWRNYTVIGTEGRIENYGDYAGDVEIRLWNKPPDYKERGDEQHILRGDIKSHGGADPKIVAEFLQFVRGEIQPSVSPIDARYSVAAGCLATQSLRLDGRVMQMPNVPESWANTLRYPLDQPSNTLEVQ
ncbi:MAG TPA: oxidoreductase [Phycisphaerales bacterium]|nr:oxidoreductase [Phycisphaerales bacterium]|tara:strand:- start:231 stop:1436 length:1206 start_codon:yes stop_codon:yes gene_type:complete